MKGFLLSAICVALSLCVFAQSRYWVGPPGGSWSSNSNWSLTSGGAPGASYPVTSNNAIFDRGFAGSVEMDILGVPTFTVNALLVTANSNVTLQRTQPGGGTRIFQLASTSASTKGLQIDNGSTLTIDAINGPGELEYLLALTGGIGVTGEISGNLYFKGTGTGTGEASLDLHDDMNHHASLVVKSTGVIKYFDDTGNTSPSTGSYLTMENGSVYEVNKNGGSFPPGNWQPNSLALVTGAVMNGPSFNGDAYGNLEWNTPLQTAVHTIGKNISFNNVNFITTGTGTPRAVRIKGGSQSDFYTMTVNGDLTVSANSLLEITGGTPPGGGGTLQVKGHLVNNGTIKTTSIFLASKLELIGTSNQNISGTGVYTGTDMVFEINGAGATLLSPLTLPYFVGLTNGKIKTDAINILTLVDNGSWFGGSSTSFVEGPMRRTGNDNIYTMPLGKGSIFAPLLYTTVSSSANYALTDTFTAEYFRSNPQSTFGVNYDPSAAPEPFDHISFVEYWKLRKNSGAFPSTNVGLFITEYSFCTNMNTTFVARHNTVDNQWKNCPTTARIVITSGPPYYTGWVEGVSDSELGIFTLATNDDVGTNPLPIDLISFDALKLSNTRSLLKWELAACCSPLAKFELQRAGNNRSFITIGTVAGSAINRFYNYTDNGLAPGVNYYRMKMTDADGTVKYSRILAIINQEQGLLLTSIIPTIIDNTAALTITSAKEQKLDLMIMDVNGRTVKKQNHNLSAGNTTIQLSFEPLRAGVYHVFGVYSGGRTNVVRVVRR